MFEQYTEKALNAVFFARVDVTRLGGNCLEPEHILLGLLEAAPALTVRFLGSPRAVEALREQLEERVRGTNQLPTSTDVPASASCSEVMSWAGEEADRLGHRHVAPEHLFLALLRSEKSYAGALLKQRGLRLEEVEQKIWMAWPEVPQEEESAAVRVTSRLRQQLEAFVKEHEAGSIAAGCNFILSRHLGTIEKADLAFVSKDEIQFPGGPPALYPAPPTLAIMVLSSYNPYEKAMRKVAAFLGAGTKLVWLVDLERKTLSTYQIRGEAHVFHPGSEFPGDPVLPGLSLKVADLFAERSGP